MGPHVELLTGFAFKSGGYSNERHGIRIIRGDNIVQGEFRWDGVKRWPIGDRKAYEKYELALDDVLIAMDRTWVSAGIKYVIVDEEVLPAESSGTASCPAASKAVHCAALSRVLDRKQDF